MEIERKFIVKAPPQNYKEYPHKEIEQSYLFREPVLRIRRYGEDYFFTYKSKGLLSRQEEEFSISKEDYEKLLEKSTGTILSKTRYIIKEDNAPTIELDVFQGEFSGLIFAEVEFSSEEEANSYLPPNWFYKEVTFDASFSNSNLSTLTKEEIKKLMREAID